MAVFDKHDYETCGCRKCGGILGQLKTVSFSRTLPRVYVVTDRNSVKCINIHKCGYWSELVEHICMIIHLVCVCVCVCVCEVETYTSSDTLQNCKKL